MTSSRPSSLLVASVLTAALSLASEPALASHYSLDRVDLVTAGERRALSRAGILDTKVLLAWTASLSRRQWLADESGLTLERLGELAFVCDLLRVEGVGPSVAAVLRRAGAIDSEALAASDSGELLGRMRVAARGTSMAMKMPDEDTVRSWIRIARRLEPVLEDGSGR